AGGELSIGARTGAYPGMQATREVRVRFVDGPRGDNGALEPAGDVTVHYDGTAQVVARPAKCRIGTDARELRSTPPRGAESRRAGRARRWRGRCRHGPRSAGAR